MLDAIKRHEEALVLLGHEPTIDYVRLHGWADGQRGPARIAPIFGLIPMGSRALVERGDVG